MNKSTDEIGCLTRSFRVSRASDRERGKNLWRNDFFLGRVPALSREREPRPMSVFNKT